MYILFPTAQRNVDICLKNMLANDNFNPFMCQMYIFQELFWRERLSAFLALPVRF